MEAIKTTRQLLLLLIAIGITTCVITAADDDYDGNEDKLKITQGGLPLTSWSKKEPIEYDIELTLRDGFTSISGRATILLKLKPHEQSKCRKVKDKLKDHLGGDKPRGDSIHLSLYSEVKITNAKLEVAKTLEDLEQAEGLREQIKIEGVVVNDDYPRVSINVGKKLNAYEYGRLEVTYETSPEAVRKYQETDRSKYQTRSLPGRENIRRLVPCFDYFALKSKVRMTIRQPDLDSVVLSNLNKLGDTTVVVDGQHYMQSEFHQTKPIDVDKIGFALGPFSNLISQRDRSGDPIISAPRAFVPLSGFALSFKARTENWMKNWIESEANCKADCDERAQAFGYWHDKRRERERDLDVRYLFKYALLEAPKDASPSEANIETALNVALAMASMHFRHMDLFYMDHWIRDGLAAHFAIRMIRELEPGLQVDEYVRTRLIPLALEHELDGNFREMAARYSPPGSDDKRDAKTVLLWHIKCAAIWDSIKRNLSANQTIFDWSIHRILFKTDRARGNGDRFDIRWAFKMRENSQRDINKFIDSWAYSVGYPLVGVTLDKKNRGIKFVQAPIDWAQYNKDDDQKDRFRADAQWPLSIKINFSNSGEISTTHNVKGFNGYLGFIRLVPLPDWFNPADPKHKVSFDILDPEELPYYRMSFSPDFMAIMNEAE